MDINYSQLLSKENQLYDGICRPIRISFGLGTGKLFLGYMPEYDSIEYDKLLGEYEIALRFESETVISNGLNNILFHNLNDIQLNWVFERLDNEIHDYVFNKNWYEVNKWLKFAYSGDEDQIKYLKESQPHLFDKRIKNDFKPLIESAIKERKEVYRKFRVLAFKKTSPNKTDKDESSIFVMTMAMFFLFEELNLKEIDKTQKAKFIEALRGRIIEDVKNTNVYDVLKNPYNYYEKRMKSNMPSKTLIKNLETLKYMFELIGLERPVEEINRQLDSQKYRE